LGVQDQNLITKILISNRVIDLGKPSSPNHTLLGNNGNNKQPLLSTGTTSGLATLHCIERALEHMIETQRVTKD
jgi:hypothetical protein